MFISQDLSLTICAILSLKLLYNNLLAIMNKSSIFSPVIADVSNENSMFLSRLNFSTFSILTSLYSAISNLLPTKNIMTSGSLYAITSLYHVDKLLKVSIRVISYAKKIQWAPRQNILVMLLNDSQPAVSQICSLNTCYCNLINMVPNSTPTVTS